MLIEFIKIFLLLQVSSLITFHNKENLNSITVNYDQQDATILTYLFIQNQLYMFRAMSSPIIRSTWLYLQYLVLSSQVLLMIGEDIARNM